MNRYAVLGTGALGGFYGSRLQKAGLEVHFLLHSDYEHVRQYGLRVISPDGDFLLPQVNAYGNVEQMPPCDVVLVALKTTQNHLLDQLLPPLLNPDSIVILMQNGLGAEPTVAKIAKHVAGGLCFICAHKIGPGVIQHIDYKAIALGTYLEGYQPAGVSPQLAAVAQDFQKAGIPTELSPDLLLTRWQKLVWNIPFNGLSVVLNATTAQMMADPGLVELIRQIMQEVARAAAGCDRTIPPSYLEERLAHTKNMRPYLTSMKLDYDHHRPLELETIFHNPIQMARRNRVATPLMEMLYQQLQFLDRQNQI